MINSITEIINIGLPHKNLKEIKYKERIHKT